MKKTIKKRKCLSVNLKFALVQIIIIVIFVTLIWSNQPIDVEETVTKEITIDEIRDIYKIGMYIYDGADEYFISSSSWLSDLKESLSVGDKLTIIYCEGSNIYGKMNHVIEARTDDITYFTLNEYNENLKGGTIGLIITFIIVEALYLFVLIFYIILLKRLK